MSDKFLLQEYLTNKDFKKYVDDREHWNENLFTYWQAFEIYEHKQKKLNIKLNKKSQFVFITIQDFKRRPCDLDMLNQFINNIKYLYCEGFYCIESGKVPPPDSNLHVHLLCKIINPKKHKQKLNLEWIKLFKDTTLYESDYYKLTQWRESPNMPPYEQWVNEKLLYFDDEKKGNHANSIDLNSRGSWGV